MILQLLGSSMGDISRRDVIFKALQISGRADEAVSQSRWDSYSWYGKAPDMALPVVELLLTAYPLPQPVLRNDGQAHPDTKSLNMYCP